LSGNRDSDNPGRSGFQKNVITGGHHGGGEAPWNVFKLKKTGFVENHISFNHSLNFFHRYRIMGVSVVSKGQDRLAGNILQNISENFCDG
jgi:hypothetical protein